MTPEALYEHAQRVFADKGDPELAAAQSRYMKNRVQYFGLKMPAWSALTKEILDRHGWPQGDDVQTLARLCFDDDHRELHYFALEVVQKSLKKQPPEFVDFLEELILRHSWWDSVDWLAKLVGLHFKKYPALARPVTERWMATGEMWLQRVSIIFQLTYREKTDVELLFQHIRAVAGSREFFLQKAAGWALRQHTRTDPEVVKTFVAGHSLSPLTRREALRLLKTD